MATGKLQSPTSQLALNASMVDSHDRTLFRVILIPDGISECAASVRTSSPFAASLSSGMGPMPGFAPGAALPPGVGPENAHDPRAGSGRGATPENDASRSSTPEERRPVDENGSALATAGEQEKSAAEDQFKDRYRYVTDCCSSRSADKTSFFKG